MFLIVYPHTHTFVNTFRTFWPRRMFTGVLFLKHTTGRNKAISFLPLCFLLSLGVNWSGVNPLCQSASAILSQYVCHCVTPRRLQKDSSPLSHQSYLTSKWAGLNWSWPNSTALCLIDTGRHSIRPAWRCKQRSDVRWQSAISELSDVLHMLQTQRNTNTQIGTVGQ